MTPFKRPLKAKYLKTILLNKYGLITLLNLPEKKQYKRGLLAKNIDFLRNLFKL